MEVGDLLSLLEGHPFSCGRSAVRFWNLDPLEGLMCKSFFHILIEGLSISGVVEEYDS